MPNAKIFIAGYATGATAYCIVRRDADAFLLDDADGAFADAPADPFVAMSEDATMKGLYTLSESRAAWDDGAYTIAVYITSGSPAPATDTLIALSQFSINSDSVYEVDVAGVWDESVLDHDTPASFGAFCNGFAAQYGVVV